MSDAPPILWRPSPENAARSRLAAFAAHVHRPADFATLHRWSVDRPEAFWQAVWEFCGVRGSPGRAERACVDAARMPGARWFPDGRLNFAANLLRLDVGDVDEARPAIVYRREDGLRRVLSWGELRFQVLALRGALRDLGITAGDRVAALLPNVPEAVVAMLAASSLGAVWSSCSPDFGTSGVLDRFAQIEPRLLIAADAHLYKEQRYDQSGRLPDLVAGLPSVERVILVPEDADAALSEIPAVGVPVAAWRDAVTGRGTRPDQPVAFEELPFDHPLYVMFSSGTTGRPKCIVHGAGGTLLQHLKEHQLHTDLRPGERLFYFTTTGWMMWNWLVSGLASGATIVLYDGSPFTPSASALWDLAAEEDVSVLGTSAKHLDACRAAGIAPARTHDLATVRTILSTGSPLLPEAFDWVYEHVKRDVQLASISGGTDILSCFALGCPLLPVYRGELSCRGLGMRVEVFDDAGRPLVDEAGELVCTAPFPSMPLGFRNDPDGSRYRAAYFERFPGVWHHGDWATLTRRGTLRITGRSDATLNPGGVRIGTAEIYRQVEGLPEIEESIVVGQDRDADQRIVLFVVLRGDATLDDDLRERIRIAVRSGTSPRHVPAVIAAVTDIPRTRSGKISELAVRSVIHGEEPRNTHALANPEALEQYRDRPELRG